MQPFWRQLGPELEIKAKPEIETPAAGGTTTASTVWTLALEYVGPLRKLRIRASGTWAWEDPNTGSPAPATPLPVRQFGPDGDISTPTPADALMPDAPLGALIGKIGGSSAAIKNTGAFLVGSRCVVEVNDTTKGPLYLTINDVPSGLTNNSGSLKVTIDEAL